MADKPVNPFRAALDAADREQASGRAGNNPFASALARAEAVRGRPEVTGPFDFARFNPAFAKPDEDELYNKPLWLTGGDNQGPASSWDSAFIKRLVDQQNELKTAEEIRNQFDRADATGVVSRDHVTAAGRDLKFGDVFDNGEYLGNLYDDKKMQATADLMMGQLTVTPEAMLAAGQDRDPATRMREEVQRIHDRNNKDFDAQLGAMQHQEDTDSRQAKITGGLEGWGADVAAAATGALGGAATGASAGGIIGSAAGGIGAVPGAVIGAGIGALFGAGSAWMNRDDVTEQMASAFEISRKAFEDEQGSLGGDLATSLGQGAGVLGRSIAPTSNFVRGLADIQAGEMGDGVAAFQNENMEGWSTGAWRAADIAASVLDAGVSFGLAAPRALFMTQMGAHSAGKVGELTLGEGTLWDSNSGSFRNVYEDEEGNVTPGRATAAWASAGIDIAQVGMAKGLANRISGGGASGVTVFDRMAMGKDTLAKTASTESVMGRKFFLDKEGKVLGQRRTADVLIPSEGVQSIAAGGMARKALAKKSLDVPTAKAGTGAAHRTAGRKQEVADELYTASKALQLGDNPMKSAIVNAFAEGSEEGAQEVLDSLAMDHSVSLEAVMMSYAYGAASGLGMSVGTNIAASKDSEKIYDLARMGYSLQTGQAVQDENGADSFRAVFDAASRVQRQQWAKAAFSGKEQELLSQVVEQSLKAEAASTNESMLMDTVSQTIIDSMTEKKLDEAGAKGDQRERLLPRSFNAMAVRDSTGSVILGSTAVADDASATDERTLVQAFEAQLKANPDDVKNLQRQVAQLTQQRDEILANSGDAGAVEARLAVKQGLLELTQNKGAALVILQKMSRGVNQKFEKLRARGDEAALSSAMGTANLHLDAMYRGDLDPDLLQTFPELKNIPIEAIQAAATHVWARPPYDNSGSFQASPYAYEWTAVKSGSTGAQFANIDAAALNQMDFDGDRSAAGISMLIPAATLQQMRTGQLSLVDAGNGLSRYMINSTAHDSRSMFVLSEAFHGRANQKIRDSAKDNADTFFVNMATIMGKRYQLTDTQTKIIEQQLRKIFLGKFDPTILNSKLREATPSMETVADAIEKPVEALTQLMASNRVLSKAIMSRAGVTSTNEPSVLVNIFRAQIKEFADSYNALQSEAHSSAGKNESKRGLSRRRVDEIRVVESEISSLLLGELFTYMTADSLRMNQIVHLSEVNAKDPELAGADTNVAAHRVAGILRAAAKESIQPEFSKAIDTFDVSGRVSEIARNMASAANLKSGYSNEYAAFVLLKSRVSQLPPGIDLNTEGSPDITVAQLLTEYVVRDIELTASTILANNPEKQRRLDFVKRAARDARLPGTKTATEGEKLLLLETIGGVIPADILGLTDTDGFDGMLVTGTIEQNVRKLSNMTADARAAVLRTIKKHPRYTEGDIYKELADTIGMYSNAQLTISAQGVASGAIAERNTTGSGSWNKLRQSVQLALTQFDGGRTPSKSDPVAQRQHLMDMFEANPSLAAKIIEAMVSELDVAGFSQTEEGRFIARDFLLDALLETDRDKSEMILWHGRTLAGMRKLGSLRQTKPDAKAEDTLVRLLDELGHDPTKQREVLAKMGELTRTEFEKYVAREVNYTKLPVLMYENQVDTFTAAQGKGGWASPSTSFGSVLREATDPAANLATAVSVKNEQRASDTAKFRELAKLYASGKTDSVQVRRYEQAVAAINQRAIALSPDTMAEMLFRVLTPFTKGHTKGATATPLEPLAVANILRDLQTGHFDSSMDTLNLLTGEFDIQDMQNRPELLAVANTLITESGARVDLSVIRGSGKTAISPKKLLSAVLDNPELQDLATELLMDKGVSYSYETGSASTVYMGASNMRELLEGPEGAAFEMKDGKYTLQADLAYGSLVSARAQRDNPNNVAPFERAVLAAVIPRLVTRDTAATHAEIQAEIIGAWRDMAQALRQSADFATSSEGSEKALQKLTANAQQHQREQMNLQRHERESSRGQETITSLWDGAVLNKTAKDLLIAHIETLKDAALDALADKIQKLEADLGAGKITLADYSTSLGHVLTEIESYPSAATFVQNLEGVQKQDRMFELTTQYEITAHTLATVATGKWSSVESYLSSDETLATRLQGAEKPVYDKWKAASNLSNAERQLLSRIVISDILRKESAPVQSTSDPLVIMGATDVKNPHKLDPQDVFDPTFANMLRMFGQTDQSLMKASIGVAKELGRDNPPNQEDLRYTLERLYHPEKVQAWTPMYAATLTALDSIFAPASAGEAITASGDLPKTMHAIAKASTRNAAPPDPATMQTVELQLQGGKITIVNSSYSGLNVYDLFGAFGTVQINGVDVEFDGISVEMNGKVLPYKAFSQPSLEKLLKKGPVTLSYFSSEHRPPGETYYNNIYYDGIVAVPSASTGTYPDLISELYMNPVGVNRSAQRAIFDAIKKLDNASFKMQGLKASGKQGASDPANVAEYFTQMTRDFISQDLGSGSLGPVNYRAAKKLIMMRHIVRLNDGSAVSVYKYQNLAAAGDPRIAGAQVEALSMRQAATLYGEVGLKGLSGLGPQVQDINAGGNLFSWQTLTARQKAVLDNANTQVPLSETSLVTRQSIRKNRRMSQDSSAAVTQDIHRLVTLRSMREADTSARRKYFKENSINASEMQDRARTVATQAANAQLQVAETASMLSSASTVPSEDVRNFYAPIEQISTSLGFTVSIDRGEFNEGGITYDNVSEFKKKLGGKLGDFAVFPLDDIFDTKRSKHLVSEQRKTFVKDLVSYFAEQGVEIRLYGAGPAGFRSELTSMLQQMPQGTAYAVRPGDPNAFVPDATLSLARYEERAASRAFSIDPMRAQARMLVLTLVEGQATMGSVVENAAYYVDPQQRVAVNSTLIKQSWSTTATPVYRTQDKQVSDMLLDINTGGTEMAEAWKAARKEAKDNSAILSLDEALQDLLNRAAAGKGLAIDTPGTHLRAGMFEVYTIAPLHFGGPTTYLFHRVGTKAPSQKDIDEARKSGQRIIISKEETEPGQTIFEGIVTGPSSMANGGISIPVEATMQEVGNKLVSSESEGALKSLMMELPDDLKQVFSKIFTSGRKIDMIVSGSDAAKKANNLHAGTSYRELAAILGVDHMPLFYKGLFGTDFDSTKEDHRTNMRALRSMLEDVSAKGTASEFQVGANMDTLFVGRSLASVFHSSIAPLIADASLKARIANLTSADAAAPTAEQQALLAALIYLDGAGTALQDIEGTPGFTDPASFDPTYMSFRPPDIFYSIFQQGALRNVAAENLRAALHRESEYEGWDIDTDTFLLRKNYMEVDPATGKQVQRHILGELSFKVMYSMGEQTKDRFDITKKKTLSTHDNRQVEMALDAEMSSKYDIESIRALVEAQSRFTPSDVTGYEAARVSELSNRTNHPWHHRGGAQSLYIAEYSENLPPFFQMLDFTRDEAASESERSKLYSKITAVANTMFDNTNGVAEQYIHSMMRLMFWSPAASDGQPTEIGDISVDDANNLLDKMLANWKDGYMPTYGGAINLLPLEITNALIRKQLSSSTGWRPLIWNETKDAWVRSEVSTAQEFYLAAFQQALNDTSRPADPAFLPTTDAVYHQYLAQTSDELQLPISIDLLRDLKLLSKDFDIDAALGERLENMTVAELMAELPQAVQASFSKLVNLQLTPAEYHDAPQRVTLARYLADESTAELFEQTLPSDEVIAAVRENVRNWRKRNEMGYPTKQSMRVITDLGLDLQDSTPKSHALIRSMMAMRGTLALANPALMPAAMVEVLWRRSLQEMRLLATGGSTSFIGAQWNKILNADNNLGVLLRGAGYRPPYTPQQMERLHRIVDHSATLGGLRDILYADLQHYFESFSGSGVPKLLQKALKFSGAMQDLARGTKAKTMTMSYINTVVEALSSGGVLYKGSAYPTTTVVTTDLALETIAADPTWVQKHYPEIHAAGLNAMNDLRGVQQTVLHKTIQGFYRPMSTHSNAGINAIGNLVFAMPLMFAGYASNFILTATGLRGIDQLAAHALQARRTPGNFFAHLRGKQVDEETMSMDDVIGNLDALDSIISMGMTHTQLFMAGFLLQGLGLSGEDEETKRRRRAAAAAGVHLLYDPRRLENDFRNKDAVFLDWLPAPLAQLAAVVDDNGEKRSVAQLHWTIKQFVSPMIGMERFLETGDMRQIMWGFTEAASSMPLINSITLHKGLASAEELTNAAADEAAAGGSAALPNTTSFLTGVVSAYESMLFESSFLNALYIGFDDYDRDPYVLPLRDSDGDYQKDVEGNTRANSDQHLRSEGLDGRGKALQTYVDDEGNIQQGYLTPSPSQVQMRTMAENRLSFALVSSLFTGLAGKGSMMRYAMPVKTREVDKPKLTEQEQEAVLMGALASNEDFMKMMSAGSAKGATQQQKETTAIALSFLNEHGNEVLTDEGAMAIFKGIAGGTTPIGSEALSGVYIDIDTRKRIQTKWIQELTIQGMEMGLTKEAAGRRATNIWYGPYDKSGPGLASVVWSTDISKEPTQEYQQLNTTYVMGPDGTPWATGFTRAKLMGALGLAPLQRIYNADDTGITLDSRGNVADGVVGVNLGQRGLKRVDDSWDIPTDVEIGDAITKAIEDLDFKSGGGGFGGFGGGGGGYAKSPRIPYGNLPRWNDLRLELDVIRAPYHNDVRVSSTENTTLRREETRRQRISSERGRLKPWQ
jgi:hypothetical protein